jgi:hypothetical protein
MLKRIAFDFAVQFEHEPAVLRGCLLYDAAHQ